VALTQDTIRPVAFRVSTETLLPVGALFFSSLATNPATLLGFGTWVGMEDNPVFTLLDTTDAFVDVYAWKRTA
jgi:hypothetical protein